MSFHAYGFLRNEDDNKMYQKTVRVALEDLIRMGKIPTQALGEFDSLRDRLWNGPEDKKVTDSKYNKIWKTLESLMTYTQN